MEPSANFECNIEIEGNAGIPQTFDMDIELNGNFTFSWSLAFDNVDVKALCGTHLLFAKELVRRTHLGAIPVMPLDPDRFLQLKGSDIQFDPQLSYIHSREIDLSVDKLPLNSLLMPFTDISNSFVSPSISLLGGFYPNTKSNSLFGVMNVFSVEIWIPTLLILFISPLILSIDSIVGLKFTRSFVQEYSNNLWTIFNAIFMPTFLFKHLIRWSYRTIIGFLLIFKVFHSILFSSQILSITIEDKYNVIDSIEDLNKKLDLEPIFFIPWSIKSEFENDDELYALISRVSKDNFLYYNHEGLMSKMDEVIDKISIKQSHIFVMSPLDADLMTGMNTNKYKPITHISNTHYLDSVYGYVVNKESDPLLKKAIRDIVIATTETGLYFKWEESALIFAYNTFGDKSFVYDLKKPDLHMVLDEIKIVLGPYIVGICLALFALLYECSVPIKHDNHGHYKSLSMQNKQSHSLTIFKKIRGQNSCQVPKALAPPLYWVNC